MEKRFVVHPGWVTSQNDGDEHWITASQLMRLYKVRPSECWIWNSLDRDPTFTYEPNYGLMIHLYPMYNGDYRQWWNEKPG